MAHTIGIGESAASNPAPGDQDPPGASRGLPFGFFLGLITGMILLKISLGPLVDGDLYWHLIAGRELASGVAADSIGTNWSFAPVTGGWTSTQWLAELLFYRLHSMGSWGALVAFRVVTAAIALAILARATLSGRRPIVAAFPYVLAAAAIGFVSQERPQQFTLIGAAALGGVLFAGLRRGVLPRWWLLLPLVALWANLHGGWVLAPVVLGLIGAGRIVDSHRVSEPVALRSLSLAALCVVAGALSPSGVSGVTAPLRFTNATANIIEWGAVKPVSAAGLVSLIMLGIFLLGWSRAGRTPNSEVLVVCALLVFLWAAWRNLAPGLALMAPLAADRLATAFPNFGNRPEPRWSDRVGIGVAVVLTLAGLALIPGKEHLPVDDNPVRLAQRISLLPPGQRVLDDYNVAGLVLFFGGPGTTVAIDGRADRYGAKYIDSYLRLENLQGDWKSLLDELDPTSALILRGTALTYVLTEERGWKEVGSDGDYVLLVRPESSG
jgi:hypothetical protein